MAAFLMSAVGVGMLVYSLSSDPEAWLSVPLFFGGLCALAASGGFYAWRGALASALLPALLVLLFPEDGPEAPADTGACDPFCADPLAGLDAALGVAAFGLVLALFGWLSAIVVKTVRRRRAPHRPGHRADLPGGSGGGLRHNAPSLS